MTSAAQQVSLATPGKYISPIKVRRSDIGQLLHFFQRSKKNIKKENKKAKTFDFF